MKRLISWLLALTLIVGLLPMSVFAVEVDTETGDDDFVVDMWELQAGGSAENRLLVQFTMNAANTEGTASVTVPAGKTLYAEYMGDPTFELSVDGVAHTFVAATGRTDTNKFEITNATDAEKTYELKIALPVGTYNNPKVIEAMNWYSDEVTQTLGDFEGYYYIYTAAEDGDVTLYFDAQYDAEGNLIEGNVRDIKVTNLNTYAQYSLLNDGVDYYGLQLVVPVKAGQQLLINTSWVEDAEGNPFPAGTYSWTGNFTYPAGTVNNPIYPEWVWDDAYANATASVTVEADGTYYAGTAGMILTANGEAVEMDEAGKFILNAGEYALVLSTPVGAYNNPEIIENIDGFVDENSLAADANYNYVWTATEAGTVTLTITDGANITVNKVVGISEDGWPVTEQYELATVEYDDSWNPSWVVADSLVIEVEADQQLNIQVNGLTDFETYSVPAIDYTLTGDFEAAEVAPEYNVVTSGYNVDMASELIASCKFLIPDELKADPDAVLKLEFVGSVTEIKIADYIAENGVDSKGRIQIKQPINSGYMNQYITVTIVDGNGYAANFTDAYGDTHEGTYQFGVETYVKSLFTYGASATMIDAVEALLTYGSYAQVYFKAKGVDGISDEPAYNILTKYGYEPVDISAFSTDLLTQELTHAGTQFDGISVRGGTPYLESAIYMVVQFNATEITEANLGDYTYELNYMVGDLKYTETLTPSWNASRGRIEFTIENIAAALFDCMYEITVTKTATGEKYTGGYSMICYFDACFTAYASNPAQADFLNLLKAMYYYNQAANAHFGK